MLGPSLFPQLANPALTLNASDDPANESAQHQAATENRHRRQSAGIGHAVDKPEDEGHAGQGDVQQGKNVHRVDALRCQDQDAKHPGQGAKGEIQDVQGNGHDYFSVRPKRLLSQFFSVA